MTHDPHAGPGRDAPPRSRLSRAGAAARAFGATSGPGIAIVALLAAACALLAPLPAAPLYLLALAAGFAARPLARPSWKPGIDWCARPLLRIGVALLGARIGIEQIAALGAETFALVAGAVLGTILVGAAVARALGLPLDRGVLTGGAVAICGASAALAVSAVLPKDAKSDERTLFTIVSVTLLSTLAMVLYPPIAAALGFTALETGVFLGGSIHDVAQVVGAAYGVSTEVGDVATLTKLSRVALLLPVCVLILALVHAGAIGGADRAEGAPLPRLPGFLLAFCALAALNSLGLVPAALQAVLAVVSAACLAAAVVALGLKTSIAGLRAVGWPMAALVVVETLFIAVLVGAFV